MKRISILLLAVGCSVIFYQGRAQQRKAAKGRTQSGARTVVKKLPQVDVFLTGTSIAYEVISKRLFDSLAKKRLYVPAGGTVQGFTFTYAEHNLYEDSVGNPLRITDYLVEYCLGDTLSAGIRSSLFDRTKPGDTAYFSDIKVMLPSGQQATGKTIVFPISR
jgi:hypothetical protein